MMGYIFLGVDDHDSTKNIECAYALSLSLKLADPGCETCVVVDKFSHVPLKYTNGFDYIVELPFGRTEINHSDIHIDFWQLYHCTPFDSNMFINTYSLAIDNIASLWDFANIDDVVFGSAIDFRGNNTRDTEKFLVQDINKIPAFNTDLIYFNKSDKAQDFFKMADPLFKGWRDVFREILTDNKATNFDFTLMTNIVARATGDSYAFPKYFDYTDLGINFLYNPQDEIQIDWIDSLNIWITANIDIKINNHRQTGILHYDSPSVVTNDLIGKLNDNYRKTKTPIKN